MLAAIFTITVLLNDVFDASFHLVDISSIMLLHSLCNSELLCFVTCYCSALSNMLTTKWWSFQISYYLVSFSFSFFCFSTICMLCSFVVCQFYRNFETIADDTHTVKRMLIELLTLLYTNGSNSASSRSSFLLWHNIVETRIFRKME